VGVTINGMRNFTWYRSFKKVKISNVLLVAFIGSILLTELNVTFLSRASSSFLLLYVKQNSQYKIVYRDWEKHLGE
jgi:hypothetical protein